MSNIRDLNPNNTGQPEVTKEMLDNAVDLVCPSCGCMFINPVVQYKLVNKLLIGTPQDMLIPIPVNRCSDCGEVFDIEQAVEAANSNQSED